MTDLVSRKTFRGNLSPTLNLRLDWQSVCRALNIPFYGEALPARVDCPKCQGSLVLYHDTAVGGEWHHCEGCGSSGDLVELAATAMGVDAESALFELMTSGQLNADAEDVDKYINSHVLARHNVNALWERAAKNMGKPSQEALSLLCRLGMTAVTNIDRTNNPMTKILGVEHYRNFNLYVRNLPLHKYGSGKNYIFKGRNWGDVLLFPYHTLPGLIVGFDIIGRGGHGAGDRMYEPTMPLQRTPTDNEAGLAGIGSVGGFDSTVVAVRDTVLMGQMQARAAHRDRQLLPVVAWRDHQQFTTNQSWSMLEGSTVLFWDTELDVKLLNQAIKTNGNILISRSKYHENERHHAKLLYNRPDGQGLMLYLRDKARPWPKVLRGYRKRVKKAEFNKLIAKLEQRGHNIDEVNRLCQNAGFSIIRSGVVIPETIKMEDKTITERNNQWFVETKKGTKPIANFILRIDSLFDDGDTRYASGRILRGKERYPFIVPATRLTANWHQSQVMSSFLTEQALMNATAPFTIAKGWGQTFIDVAMTFRKPRLIKNTSLCEQRRKLGV
jgi:hypothetical protein